MYRLFVGLAGAAVLAGSLATAGASAAAHEKRSAGPYALEVGWLIEPAYVSVPNAVFLEVVDAQSDLPVDHLDQTLMVEVIVGGAAARRTFDLQVIAQEPGHYQARFVPTAAGDYTFRVFGTIGSLRIDERFESGPGRFDPVVSDRPLQFPRPTTTSDDLAERLDQVGLIAIAGLLVGGAALITSIVALLMRRR